MATYVRQSSFSDGDTITAALFNNEFNQLVNAFNVATGHTHDGSTAGDGGPISNLFSNALVFGTNTDNNVVITFNANSNDGVLSWMEDEDYFQFSDDLLLTTTEKVQFRDTAIYINSSTDGQLDIVADTEIQIAATTIDMNGNADISGNLGVGGNLTVTGTTTFNGGTITMGDAATDNVVFGADVDSNIIPDDDDTYDLGSSTQQWRNLYIDGTANIDSLVADTADINGGTIDAANITVGSGKTLDVSAGSLTLADNQISGDKVEGGTINATTINTLTYGSITDGTITVTAFVDEDNMASNSATLIPTQQSVKAYVDAQDTAQDLDLVSDSGTIAIDLDGETLTVTGGEGIDTSASSNTLTITGEDATTSNKGIASFNSDDFNVSSGAVTLATTSTAAELNLLDGTTAGTIVASKGVAVDANKDITGFRNITLTGELDAGSLDVSGNVDVDGTLETDALSINGTAVTSTAAELNILDGKAFLDEDNMASNSATGIASQQSIKAYVDAQQDTVDTLAEILALSNATGGTDIAVGTGDDITFSDSSKAIFGTGGSDLQIYHDPSAGSIIQEGGSGSLFIRASTNIQLEGVNGENMAIFNENGSVQLYYDNAEKLATTSGGISVTGVVAATSLDISGDIDVDGTTNLDVVDIDGAVDMASVLQVNGTITTNGNLDITSAYPRINLTDSGANPDYSIINADGVFTVYDSTNGSNRLTINSSGAATFTGAVTANAGVVVDNITIDGNEIDVGSGDLTLDVAGDIILNADDGEVLLQDGSVTYGQLKGSTSDFIIQSLVSDKDIIFKGLDGAAIVTALTLDMSNAGKATFNSHVALGDSKQLQLGADADMIIYHDGTTNYVQAAKQDSDIILRGNDGGTGVNALTLDMSAAGAATFNAGVTANRLIVTDGVVDTGQAGSATVFNESGSTADFRVESTANANMLFVDGGNNRVGIGTGSPDVALDVIGTTTSGIRLKSQESSSNGFNIYNDSSSDTAHLNNHFNGSMIFSTNNSPRLTIAGGGAATFNSTIAATSATFTTADNSAQLTLVSTDTDASVGPRLDLYRNSSSPANGDVIGEIQFQAKDSVNSTTTFATISSQADQVDNGAEDGSLRFKTLHNGTLAERITIAQNNHVIINETGVDADFRVESDGNANMLFVDGGNNRVGIGTAPSSGYVFHINAGSSGKVKLAGDSAKLEFDNSGTFIEAGGNMNLTAVSTMLMTAGSTNLMTATASAVTFNEGSADQDFRVESNGNANMLFVDGGDDRVNVGSAVARQSISHLIVRNNASAIEFGHLNNSAGFFGTLGAFGGNGHPYLGFSTACDTYNQNTFSTFGAKGSLIKGDTSGNLIFAQVTTASATGQTPIEIARIGTSEMVINEDSYDYDFRVESNGNANMLFVDGGNNRIGIGTSSPSYAVDIQAQESGNANMRLLAGTSGSASIRLQNDAAHFDLNCQTNDNFAIYDQQNNRQPFTITSGSASLVVNEDSKDMDFRVESDGNTHMLFVDGGNNRVGIGMSAPESLLHLYETASATGQITLSSIFGSVEHNAGRIGWTHASGWDTTIRLGTASNHTASYRDELIINKDYVVINDGGNDTDFRVESSGNANMLTVDGGANSVLVGTSDTLASRALFVKFNAYPQQNYATNASVNYPTLQLRTAYATGGQTATQIDFRNGADAAVGTIKSTVNATAYNTSSDQRLKENIVDAPSASDEIDAIQVRSFDWKANGLHQKYGMVAQELLSVVPDAVAQGDTEEDMMGVDYSKLVPMLVKEIQTLRNRVEQLENS